MWAAIALWLVVSPFLAGAAVWRCGPANRFVARHYWPSFVVGWIGVAVLLTAVFVLDGPGGHIGALAASPLAGLSFWSRRDGGDDGHDDPDDDPEPDFGLDWEQFVRDFGAYVAGRDQVPA